MGFKAEAVDGTAGDGEFVDGKRAASVVGAVGLLDVGMVKIN